MMLLRRILTTAVMLSAVCSLFPVRGLAEEDVHRGTRISEIVGHLQQAVQHLEAAGLVEEARRIQQHLHEENKKEPVARQRANDSDAQIVVHTQLIELSPSKLRKLGLDWEAFDGDSAKGGDSMSLSYDNSGPQTFRGERTHDPKNLSILMEVFCENGLARVLAEPTLVTLAGRPASLSTGGEARIPESGPYEKEQLGSQRTGTRLDVVSKMINGGKVRLDLRLEWSGLNWNPEYNNVASKVRRYKVDTVVEAELGRTIIVGGSATGSPEETVLYLLVRPELVTPLPSVQQSSATRDRVLPSPMRR